jgi:S-adenosyl methyltransferase
MLLIILPLIRDADDPYGLVARLLGTLPAGSQEAVAQLYFYAVGTGLSDAGSWTRRATPG